MVGVVFWVFSFLRGNSTTSNGGVSFLWKENLFWGKLVLLLFLFFRFGGKTTTSNGGFGRSLFCFGLKKMFEDLSFFFFKKKCRRSWDVSTVWSTCEVSLGLLRSCEVVSLLCCPLGFCVSLLV